MVGVQGVVSGTLRSREGELLGRRVALYEVRDGGSGEVLSRHRTRQAAVDTWRLKFAHRPAAIYRVGHRDEMLVVEGVWHEPQVAT